MRILLLISVCFVMLSAEVTGLRKIKVGEPVPNSGSLNVFDAKGNQLILYIKSKDIKSITFFKSLARTLGAKKKKDLTLYVVDAEVDPDPRVSAVYDSLNIDKVRIADGDRNIFGELGVIVIPTLLVVKADHTLHSLVAGYRANLGLFFKSYLDALARGKPAGDVYKAAGETLAKRKASKLLNQGFRLLIDADYPLAVSIYDRAVKDNPETGEARLGKGYALLLDDKITEGLAHFTALKEEASSRRVLLGYHLCRALIDATEEDLEQIAALAQKEPRFFFVVFKAAEVLDKAGKCEESKAVYRHAYKVLLRSHRRNKS